MSVRLTAAFLFFSLLAGAADEDIPVIGLDATGQESRGYVTRDHYTRGLGKMMAATTEETLNTLDRAPAGRQWRIRSISVGVGLEAKIGLSPFFQLGIAPRFRATFTDSSNFLACHE